MGNVIPFPAKRIIRRQPTPQQKESDTKIKKAKEKDLID